MGSRSRSSWSTSACASRPTPRSSSTASGASPIGRRYARAVEQRVTLVTLGVADYARAKEFYEANGVVLVLWARDKLADDMSVPDDGARWSGIALAHNVRSREEVHEVIEQARSNGAEVTREPSETFYGGYAGAFRDLDGHAWEVAHNPGFSLDDGGNVVLPT